LSSVALTAGVSSAGAEPFSLKLSETVTYDTNYGRTAARQGEVISSTAVQVGLNKPYGRQNYTGSAKFGVDRHKNIKNQDNQNYDVDLGFSTEIASNWAMSLSGSANESLNPNQNNALGDRLAKNVRSYHDMGLNVQYGVSGRWALVTSAATSRTSYSLASSKFQNQEQVSGGLRVVYNTSDLLNFGVGTSYVRSQYPRQIVAGVNEEVRQHSLDFSSNWQVTGFSALSAVLSLTENKYKSDPNAKFKGVTGRANWNFTPSGVTSYSLGLSRSTDNDATATGIRTGQTKYALSDADSNAGITHSLDTSYNNVTTSINGGLRWAPTAKLSFNTSLAWNHYDVSKTIKIATLNSSGNTSSRYAVLALSSDYSYSRSIGFGCGMQYYKQTAESNPTINYGNPHVPYNGNQYNCNANFKID